MNKDISIFPFQEKILQSTKAMIVAICGRSSGKSHAAAWWAFIKSLNTPGVGLICAPTYQQAEMPIKYLIGILDDLGIPNCFNKIPPFTHPRQVSYANILTIDFPSGVKMIKMASGEKPDNLRSGSYSWAVLDEACYIRESVWQIIAPTLRGEGVDFTYQTLMISSPAGKDWIYESFIEKDINSVEVIRAPSWENIFQVDQVKLDFWKETMSSRMYQQEIEAEILDSNLLGIFYAWNPRELLMSEFEGIKSKYIVSLDQNVRPGTGVIIRQRDDNYYVEDEIYIDDGATHQSYVTEIIKKVPPSSTIILTGDRSGNNRSVASLDTFYKSVITELKKQYTVIDKTLKKNPAVLDSREEINRLMERRKLFINPTCKHLIKDFELASWKEGSVYETDKKKYDPHVAEALVYGIWSQRPSPINLSLGKI